MNQRKNAMWSINNGVAGDALKHTGNSCGRFLAKKTTSMVFPDLTFSKGLRYRSFCWKTDKVGAQQVFGCYIIDGPQEMSYKMKKKEMQNNDFRSLLSHSLSKDHFGVVF